VRNEEAAINSRFFYAYKLVFIIFGIIFDIIFNIKYKYMTEDKMYELMSEQLRYKGVEPLAALAYVLKKSGSEIKPYYIGDKHLYVLIDRVPFNNIEIIAFLAKSKGLELKIVTLPRELKIEGYNQPFYAAYLNIYSK
jgi:hypothetical protein